MKTARSLAAILTAAIWIASGLDAQAQRRIPHSRTITDTSLVRIGAELKIRLREAISSKDARVGDRFSATVVDPNQYDGAKVYGHISSMRKSGRIKGTTTIGFAFDRIELRDGRSGPMRAQLIRIYDSDSVKVGEEGEAESGSRGKQTLKRGGIGAAAGAIIGGIVGGGKGAAIGLIIGGAAGAGSLAIKGGKELRLEPGTEMLIRVTRR
jgi:hypothetical protein